MDRLMRNILANKDKLMHTPKSVIEKANKIADETDKKDAKSLFHIDDVLNIPPKDL